MRACGPLLSLSPVAADDLDGQARQYVTFSVSPWEIRRRMGLGGRDGGQTDRGTDDEPKPKPANMGNGGSVGGGGCLKRDHTLYRNEFSVKVSGPLVMTEKNSIFFFHAMKTSLKMDPKSLRCGGGSLWGRKSAGQQNRIPGRFFCRYHRRPKGQKRPTRRPLDRPT